MKDVLLIRKVMIHMTVDGPYIESAADANQDGEIDMKDILLIRKHIANIVFLGRITIILT